MIARAPEAPDSVPLPFVSVVVAAHSAEGCLPRCLAALAASDLPRERWELIVVDDASTDATAAVAAEHADLVVRLPGNPHGPAYARNRGCDVARGGVLVFVDADVCVHPDTLDRFARLFAESPWLGAAFGSYDADPPAPGIVSQFRNLLHHYVHQRGAGRAETFWSGCGAIRREVFLDVEMFDEWHYPRPQVEDIEMGRRLRSRGYRIELRPEIQCTHLKRWTLRGMLVTDLVHRGVPWMRILLQEGTLAEFRALNLRRADRYSAAFALLVIIALVSAAAFRAPFALAPAALAASGLLTLNGDFYLFLLRQRGPLFLLAAIPLHVLHHLMAAFSAGAGYLAYTLFGPPLVAPVTEAQDALGIRTWPPCPRRPTEGLWAAGPRRPEARARQP